MFAAIFEGRHGFGIFFSFRLIHLGLPLKGLDEGQIELDVLLAVSGAGEVVLGSILFVVVKAVGVDVIKVDDDVERPQRSINAGASPTP